MIFPTIHKEELFPRVQKQWYQRRVRGMQIVYLCVSAILGALFGLFESCVIAFSLLEISISTVFAIVFGVGFCLLSFALARRIWVSVPVPQKYPLLFFSVMVLASGIASFFLRNDWIKNFGPSGKVPLYGLLGISFAFTITYSFSELIALSPWDQCCGTNSQVNPVFGSSKQIFALFGCSLLLGACAGLIFGLTDVEDDDSSHNELLHSTLYCLPLGLVGGLLFGFGNEWYRQKNQGISHLVPKEPKENDELL
eukprot:TRINITY_DN9746_c0_g1_i5.p1 TRINITY_DN9746_c0_g1~~TRINITY_DN9746_c0_g1_i5.p1  ORF type:complete len:253 (+),score=50.78 TRINITY_DN9746_c0_g1_i5:446-1204(+)